MRKLAVPVDPARDHLLGDGPLELVVYGDYQCPYTANAMRIVRRLRGRMGDELRFVYRHFPLRHKHPQAQAAAEAAEAAALQGRFWDMHDQLFGHQRELREDGTLRACAHAAGCDVERFSADFDAGAGRARVGADLASGLSSGVTGTPRLFIAGVMHEGFYDLETLEEELRA